MAFHGLSLHRLPAKISLSVSGICAIALVAAFFAGAGMPWWGMVLIPLTVGMGTYPVAKAFLVDRINQAFAAVKQIHQDSPDKPDSGDELDQLLQQIDRTSTDVHSQMQELEQIEHYRREFLGNVSHELKTPIFSIRGFADTLLNGALEDVSVRRSFVQKIQHNAARLGNLAEDLGQVARIEMGELTMTVTPFNLRSVVHEVTESIEPLARRRQVTVSHTIAEYLPAVNGDRERIGQVVSNLIDNAVKYSKRGGHVEVGARLLPSGQVKISVVDDGIGIAPEHIERLTERFFRVDTSRSRSQGGTGLGLAIVKHILGAHGSQLMIKSSLGRGSTFGFSLPTVSAPPAL